MKKILIVDDFEQNLILLDAVLKSQKYEVLSAKDGEAALTLARENQPDLIVTDILMPTMDGYTLCREWKKDPLLQAIPLIFYSATYTDPKDLEFAFNLGAAEFIVKPELPEKIAQTVKEVLSGRSNGKAAHTGEDPIEEREYHQTYNRRLVKKLEKKMLDLQRLNKELQEEISKRKKIETLWNKTVNVIDDLLTVQDKNRNIIEANDATLKFFNAKPEELIGKKCYAVFCGQDSSCQCCPTLESLAVESNHSQIITCGQQDKIFLVCASAILAESGEIEYFVHLAKDITALKKAEAERLKLEAQLRQKYKMEAIGIMAGGVAHNFNNSLAVILGNIEISRMKLPTDSEICEYLNNAKSAILRSRDLVLQILTYSKQSAEVKNIIKPALVLTETLNMLECTIPRTVNLQQQISSEAQHSTINADSSQFQEILFNLSNNAIHAMNEKGDLTFFLNTVDIRQTDIPDHYQRPVGSYLKLSVQDTGSGMNAETIAKIFDPFFTTKEVGQGTGMGLSTVHAMVAQHNGFIKVNSTPAQGSTFELYFPLVDAPAHEVSPVSVQIPPRPGHERILFVDDEESLAELGKEMLSEAGYQVSSFTQSAQALETFRSTPNSFDLVITDQSMPIISGKELILELRKIRPGLPVILMTGYSNKIDAEEAQKLGVSAFCMKPMDQFELLRIIRTALDKN